VAGRGIFSSCKAEDESGLTPGEDDNAAGRKKNRPDAAQGFQNRSNIRVYSLTKQEEYMKRSLVNAKIKEAEALLAQEGFKLPKFFSWTPEEWKSKGHEYDEIRDNMLGWDVTDYGMGDYDKLGITLLTIRNGNVHDDRYAKPYCEKIVRVQEGQMSPMHFHYQKMEDIINRGGGNLMIQFYKSTEDYKMSEEDVTINADGRQYTAPAGTVVRLTPGESVSFYPYTFHEITIEPGTGATLLGEVSTSNDDKADNYFLEAFGRFPTIEEDEPPYRLLCTEYPSAAD